MKGTVQYTKGLLILWRDNKLPSVYVVPIDSWLETQLFVSRVAKEIRK
jgi:hypothetical protein